jgi:hypothetical protein
MQSPSVVDLKMKEIVRKISDCSGICGKSALMSHKPFIRIIRIQLFCSINISLPRRGTDQEEIAESNSGMLWNLNGKKEKCLRESRRHRRKDLGDDFEAEFQVFRSPMQI